MHIHVYTCIYMWPAAKTQGWRTPLAHIHETPMRQRYAPLGFAPALFALPPSAAPPASSFCCSFRGGIFYDMRQVCAGQRNQSRGEKRKGMSNGSNDGHIICNKTSSKKQQCARHCTHKCNNPVPIV